MKAIKETGNNLVCALVPYDGIGIMDSYFLEDGQELEFSDGFNDLHTQSYKDILADGGFGVKDVKKAIEIVSGIRNTRIS